MTLHRLFVISAGSKYRFTPEITSSSLSTTESSNEQVVCSPTTKPNPSHPNERVCTHVQDPDSALKGTTSLLTLKWDRSEFHIAPYVPSSLPKPVPEMGGLLSQRYRAALTHADQRTSLNKQEFIVSSGLRSSYLGHH